jgi:hypothetical protein
MSSSPLQIPFYDFNVKAIEVTILRTNLNYYCSMRFISQLKAGSMGLVHYQIILFKKSQIGYYVTYTLKPSICDHLLESPILLYFLRLFLF